MTQLVHLCTARTVSQPQFPCPCLALCDVSNHVMADAEEHFQTRQSEKRFMHSNIIRQVMFQNHKNLHIMPGIKMNYLKRMNIFLPSVFFLSSFLRLLFPFTRFFSENGSDNRTERRYCFFFLIFVVVVVVPPFILYIFHVRAPAQQIPTSHSFSLGRQKMLPNKTRNFIYK